MKKTVICSLIIVACVSGMASGFEGDDEANVTNSIEYSLFLPGGAEPIEGGDYGEGEDLVLFEGSGNEFSVVARGTSSETSGGGLVGSGSSCSMRDSVDVDYISITSQATSTKRMYLSDNYFSINYFWDGELKLLNPYIIGPFTGGDFELDFGEEGQIELGYRIDISAESIVGPAPDYFWQTMPEYGAWHIDIASAEGSMTIDSLTGAVTAIDPVDVNGNETYGYWVENDIGKPFDVTITLETWIEGYSFDITEIEDGIFALSSNFIDTLGADAVSGATEQPIPEPGSCAMLLCLIMSSILAVRRRY